MSNHSEIALTSAEQKDLRRLAGFMVPVSDEHSVPGADDELIFADIVRSLGRDSNDVRQALSELKYCSGGEFSALGAAEAEAAALAFLGRKDASIVALGRVVLQCYYRDDRVFRSIGREPRAPFPRGHVVEQGDWTLLDAVKGRPRMWRDVDKEGA